MKIPNVDPLLLTILNDDENREGHGDHAASLATVLAAAQRRRRTRRLQKGLGMAALPVLALAGAIWLRLAENPGKPLPAPPLYTLVRTHTLESTAIVRTGPNAGHVTTTDGSSAQQVSTGDLEDSLEWVSDEDTFLALFPPGAGFIGEGAERRFIWLGAANADVGANR